MCDAYRTTMTSAPRLSTSVKSDPTEIDDAVLSTVAYGDIFEYPLRDAEVHRYLHGVHATLALTIEALARCCAPGGPLSMSEGYYTLRGREALVDTRRDRAARAAELWPEAARYGRVFGGLPFVRLVAVTGSLAWNNVHSGADIDFLIVTEPDHLWTCRWLVSLVKRIARRRGTWICPNYIVSTRALPALHCDLYDAYELASMIPLVGIETYFAMRRANPWAARYLPNAVDAPATPARRVALSNGLARGGETLLRSRLGATIERYEMQYRRAKIRRARIRSNGANRGEGAHTIDRCMWFGGGHRLRALAAFEERLHQLWDTQ
jgi:hypothetical protein